jgi:hypothetical protein
MPGQKSNSVKLASGAVFAVVIGAVFLSSPAQAGEQPLKGRYINLSGENNCTKIGDKEEGHIICTYELPSTGIRDDGEIYGRVIKGTLDWTKGAGSVEGYTVSTFADGSMLVSTYEGVTKVGADKVQVSEGTLTCVSGSGRFQGAKCQGTWKNHRAKAGYTVGDYEGTLTLPD